jgi:tetratricopeptide (TPR) repeat protein
MNGKRSDRIPDTRKQWALRKQGEGWGIHLLVMLVLLLAASANGWAQFAAEPQADTPEEFDAFLVVLSRSTPKDIISAAEDFERTWPRSTLCASIYEMELEAYRSLGDSAGAIQAGEKALKAVPNNLSVLARLAYFIADSSSDPAQLVRAEELARTEIQKSKSIRLPRWMSPARWDEIQGRLGTMAHSALGLVAYKRGNLALAIRETETAMNLTPTPDPALYYRLGLLHKASGDTARAIQELQKAAASSDSVLRPLAQRQLKALQP